MTICLSTKKGDDNEFVGFTALFIVFVGINKHQNLSRWAVYVFAALVFSVMVFVSMLGCKSNTTD